MLETPEFGSLQQISGRCKFYFTIFIGGMFKMKKLIFILVIAMLASTAHASMLYEDFETTGDQYSLFGNAFVAGGYLNTPGDWTGGAVLDGTYPASVSDPSIKTATFNFLGNTYEFTSVTYQFGTKGTDLMGTQYAFPQGWLIRYMPLKAGVGNIRLYHNTDVRTEVYNENHEMPGGFDLNADYEMVVEDSGTSVTFWVQDAANPTINTGQVTWDTSTLERFGDQDAMAFVDMEVHGGGFDDVTIVPEPATIALLCFGASVLLRRRRV